MKKPFLFLSILLLTTSAMAAATGRLPFIQDNYARALALAQQRKLPIFVEVWAPW